LKPPPSIIAHRGASGYLPEHTLVAKALAFGQGADYLEQDVVATRDGALLVLHDAYLEEVTDVAIRFPGRQRSDGHYYVIDFDLAEIRQLIVHNRRLPGEAPGAASPLRLRIVTLDEELAFVGALNRATGKRVGVYPEIKHPRWHREHGIDLARLLIAELERFDYRGACDPVFVQCFDAQELRRVREELGSPLPLIQLVEEGPEHAELLSVRGLETLARHAQGLGPALGQLVRAAAGGKRPWETTPLVKQARDAGLLLHPYTFRRRGLPEYAQSLEALLEIFLGDVGVDGVFCDYPDVAVRIRERVIG
jgi:glycerophosphoryl diester phosphodiesterase